MKRDHEDRNVFEARPAITKLVREGLGLLVSASGSEKPGAKFIPCNIHQNPAKVLVVHSASNGFGVHHLWICMDLSFRNMVFQDDHCVTPFLVDSQRSHCDWPLGSRSLVGQHAPVLRSGVDCDHASVAQGPGLSPGGPGTAAYCSS